MKVATRLTVMLLACLAPLALAYSLATVRSTTLIFAEDLKNETRIAERALNASFTPDMQQGEWDEVHDILQAIGSDDFLAALLDQSGRIRFALPGFPIKVPPLKWISSQIGAHGAAEFMSEGGGASWFCRIVRLGSKADGYLIVAQDWSALRRDRTRRIGAALAAITLLLVLSAGVIMAVAQRYVAQPLAGLHRRISRLGETDLKDQLPGGDEVRLISEEFQRLDRELAGARRRLLEENERKLQLERRLLHADKLATIGTLASGFAHEIGTPLGVIRSRAELLLKQSSAPAATHDGLQVIVDQIDRIARMVRMLLELGRRRESIRVPADLREIADRTIHLLETEAQRRAVTVVREFGDHPLMVDCDPDQLQQVFVNLEINALDAMAGGGTLQVRSLTNGDARRVRILFEDTGPGIPEAIRDRIFDPFFTTKEPGRGTGMGLAVSQSIVASHDGELVLDRNSSGARFIVSLPASHAAILPTEASEDAR
jgi:signal transduction histidine kinase